VLVTYSTFHSVLAELEKLWLCLACMNIVGEASFMQTSNAEREFLKS